MRYKLSFGEGSFRVINYVILALLGLITLFPFWYLIVLSFSDPVTGKNAYFWPKDLYAANYWLVFRTGGIWQAYLISVLRVVAAVPLMRWLPGVRRSR